jgi:hypothetical protein
LLKQTVFISKWEANYNKNKPQIDEKVAQIFEYAQKVASLKGGLVVELATPYFLTIEYWYNSGVDLLQKVVVGFITKNLLWNFKIN